MARCPVKVNASVATFLGISQIFRHFCRCVPFLEVSMFGLWSVLRSDTVWPWLWYDLSTHQVGGKMALCLQQAPCSSGIEFFLLGCCICYQPIRLSYCAARLWKKRLPVALILWLIFHLFYPLRPWDFLWLLISPPTGQGKAIFCSQLTGSEFSQGPVLNLVQHLTWR